MSVDTVKMSSKGQIVIPQEAREEIHADTGTVFAIVVSKDMIVLKKIPKPSKEELIKGLRFFAKKSRRKLQQKGFTEKDLQER